MFDLTPAQIATLERLLTAGFHPVKFPLYENAIGIAAGNCAALLKPTAEGALGLLAAPSFIIDNNLTVRIRRNGKHWFVWKKKELEVTAERQAELENFTARLESLLRPPS
ncbi:MAG TPA: hypothetical protein VOA41_15145 [Candidatus Dormibacteraeota bacterium]|nr:hypothetical protein [Candidatus Dormibacteraeota bacterium]